MRPHTVAVLLVGIIAGIVPGLGLGCSYNPPERNGGGPPGRDTTPRDSRTPSPGDAWEMGTEDTDASSRGDAREDSDAGPDTTGFGDTGASDTRIEPADGAASDTEEMDEEEDVASDGGADADGCADGSCSTGEQRCADQRDNDGDGRADCRDTDCDRKVCGGRILASGPYCCEPGRTNVECAPTYCDN